MSVQCERPGATYRWWRRLRLRHLRVHEIDDVGRLPTFLLFVLLGDLLLHRRRFLLLLFGFVGAVLVLFLFSVAVTWKSQKPLGGDRNRGTECAQGGYALNIPSPSSSATSGASSRSSSSSCIGTEGRRWLSRSSSSSSSSSLPSSYQQHTQNTNGGLRVLKMRVSES